MLFSMAGLFYGLHQAYIKAYASKAAYVQLAVYRMTATNKKLYITAEAANKKYQKKSCCFTMWTVGTVGSSIAQLEQLL